MNTYKSFFNYVIAVLMLWVSGIISVYAQPPGNGVTYSPEHWPNRWSSVIRQQQDARFPTRQKPKAPPKQPAPVSERDLFYLPSTAQPSYVEQHHRDRDARGQQHRYLRGARPLSRDAAYAYHGMYPMYAPHHFMSGQNSFAYGTAPLGIDPVLGHPSMGVPMMPGVPYGYPYMGHPGFNSWYPHYRRW